MSLISPCGFCSCDSPTPNLIADDSKVLAQLRPLLTDN